MIWFIFSFRWRKQNPSRPQCRPRASQKLHTRFTRASGPRNGTGSGGKPEHTRSGSANILPPHFLLRFAPCWAMPTGWQQIEGTEGDTDGMRGYSKKWSSLPPRWTYTVPYSTSKMNRSNNELTLFDRFHYVSSMLGGLQRNSTIRINGISTRIDQLHTWSIAVAILMHGIWICMVHDVTLSRHSPTKQGPSKTTPSKSPVISA